MRSNVTRRIQTRRSAGGAGFNPFSSSFARRNRSTGPTGHDGSFTAGGLVAPTGRQAQCSRLRFSRSNRVVDAEVSLAVAGQLAPAFTQAARSAIVASVSFPFGGI